MVSCILLSAGFSSRFGSPKALARFDDTTTVIESLQSMLVASLVDEIIVVLGAEMEQIKPFLFKHKKVKVVYNKDHKFGQTSSFKTGLLGIDGQSLGICLLPVDYPIVSVSTIDALIGNFKKDSPAILIPTYNNIKGHPPVFHIKLKEEFLNLDKSVGINTVAQKYPQETVLLPVQDEGILSSFNTQEEFSRIKQYRSDYS